MKGSRLTRIVEASYCLFRIRLFLSFRKINESSGFCFSLYLGFLLNTLLRTHTWPGDLRLNSYRYSRTPGRTFLMYLISHVKSHLGVEVHQPISCDRSLGIPLGIQKGSRRSRKNLGDLRGIYLYEGSI
jgi:hypothetical protein